MHPERGGTIEPVATVPTIPISAPCPKTKVARQALIDYMSSNRLSGLEMFRRQIEAGRFDPTGVPTDVLWGLALTGLIRPAAPGQTVASVGGTPPPGGKPASLTAARTSSAPSRPPQTSSTASPSAPSAPQVTGVSQSDWARLVSLLDRDVQHVLELALVRVDQAGRQITLTYPATMPGSAELMRLCIPVVASKLHAAGANYRIVVVTQVG